MSGNLDLAPMGVEGFSVEPGTTEGVLTIKLIGSCDSQAIYVLEGFLAVLHKRAVAEAIRQITLDCEELYFMSSTALKTFVTWLQKVSGLGPEQRYQVALRTNRALSWQARSFGAIRRSVPDVLTLLV